MKLNRVLMLGALAGACLSAQAVTLVTSTFDTGAEGWTTVLGASSPSFVASGGDPGGYVTAMNMPGTNVWAWKASSAYLGDMSAAFGGTLSFDEMVSKVTKDKAVAPTVKIVSSTITLATGADYQPGKDWSAYSVALKSGAWHLDTPTGALATDLQIMTALSNVSALYIRGDYSPGQISGSVVTGLDTVVLTSAVPEPGAWAMWLAGSLVVGSLALRRRHG